ncbi:MAG: hypothetical protein HQK94_18415 [Nitrospirae bacterium]|nr:hypothetical protein [Nitrospirota bacterium]
METLYGVTGTIFNNIFFTESFIANAAQLKRIRVEISRQNSNLTKIKEKMANEAKVVGATAIMNFKYGQRAHKRWDLVFSFKWDTESWYGEGDAIKI